MGKFGFVKSGKSVKVFGSINEFSDFSDLFDENEKIITVDCSGVNSLNSFGLRAWVEAVNRFKGRVNYKNCAVVMVEQFSMAPESLGVQPWVNSFFAPFYCNNCISIESILMVLGKNFDFDQVEVSKPIICQKCGRLMEPDFVEEEYFAFIEQIKIQQDPGNRRSDKVVDEQSPRKPYFTKVIFQDFKVVFNGRPTRAVGYSKNISVGGLFIYFFHEIPVGERITVKFEIPNGKSVHILEAQAEVRWLKEIDPQRERLPGIGIKLINLKKEDEEVIQKYIDSF